jgi:hypothetical protein
MLTAKLLSDIEDIVKMSLYICDWLISLYTDGAGASSLYTDGAGASSLYTDGAGASSRDSAIVA